MRHLSRQARRWRALLLGLLLGYVALPAPLAQTTFFRRLAVDTLVACTCVASGASGAKVLNPGSIASAMCTGDAGQPALDTAAAPGTTSADVIVASFSGDVSGVTGYAPLTTGAVRIDVYPTADTATFKICNSSSSAIDPGSITVNWRVIPSSGAVFAAGATTLNSGSALSSAKCTGDAGEPGLITVAIPGLLTTDIVATTFNGTISATTGYTPATSGSLRVDAYPTTGVLNLKLCNGTASSVTPGATTLNWLILR